MLNDLPYRTAQARNALTRSFQEMYGVDEQRGALLTLSVLSALVQAHLAGGPAVTVQGEDYHVGDDPLLPHVLALAAVKDRYLSTYDQSPYDAHGLIQQSLLDRLRPSRRACSAPMFHSPLPTQESP